MGSSKATGRAFAQCKTCGLTFFDTTHAREAGVWCPHLTFVWNGRNYEITKGNVMDARFFTVVEEVK